MAIRTIDSYPSPPIRRRVKDSPRAPPIWSSRCLCLNRFRTSLRPSSPSTMSSGSSSSANATARIPNPWPGAATEITMTEEDFLARWSRRKREVAKEEAAPRAEKTTVENRSAPDTKQPAEPEFDIASLPPIDSINALTDVTQFLRDGVPADLARAALRRVWTADPAIRD